MFARNRAKEKAKARGIRVVMGQGTVAVTSAMQDGRHILMLEEGLGTGLIGQPVPGRQPEDAPIPSEIVDEAVILEFGNLEALQVVIDALAQIKEDMLSNPLAAV